MSGGTSNGFLKEIEAFMRRNDLSATRFGVLAAGDTKFVGSIRKGRQPRQSTQDNVRAWMKSQERQSC